MVYAVTISSFWIDHFSALLRSRCQDHTHRRRYGPALRSDAVGRNMALQPVQFTRAHILLLYIIHLRGIW